MAQLTQASSPPDDGDGFEGWLRAQFVVDAQVASPMAQVAEHLADVVGEWENELHPRWCERVLAFTLSFLCVLGWGLGRYAHGPREREAAPEPRPTPPTPATLQGGRI